MAMRTSRLLPEGDHALAGFFQSLHLTAQNLQVLWLQHQHTSLHKGIVQRHLPPHACQARFGLADAVKDEAHAGLNLGIYKVRQAS